MNRRDFKGNVWRHLCAKAIEANCGYSSRWDRYALSWTVGVYESVPGFHEMMKRVYGGTGDYALDPATHPLDPELLAAFEEEWDEEEHQNHLWEWVVEDMARNVTEADTYNSIGPDNAKRYGLDYSEVMPRSYARITDEKSYYPAAKPGWMLVNPWAKIEHYGVEWEFAGRGGKHLCLTEFEGISLRLSSDNLSADITSDTDGSTYGNRWCQKLLAFIHECDLMFNREAIKSEFQYQVDFRFSDELNEVVCETRKKMKEAAERNFWAERDVMTVE